MLHSRFSQVIQWGKVTKKMGRVEPTSCHLWRIKSSWMTSVCELVSNIRVIRRFDVSSRRDAAGGACHFLADPAKPGQPYKWAFQYQKSEKKVNFKKMYFYFGSGALWGKKNIPKIYRFQKVYNKELQINFYFFIKWLFLV